jgi:hypothetical protein
MKKGNTLSASMMNTAELVAEAALLGEPIGVEKSAFETFLDARKGSVTRDGERNSILYSDGGVSFVYREKGGIRLIDSKSICPVSKVGDKKDVIYSLVESMFRLMPNFVLTGTREVPREELVRRCCESATS